MARSLWHNLRLFFFVLVLSTTPNGAVITATTTGTTESDSDEESFTRVPTAEHGKCDDAKSKEAIRQLAESWRKTSHCVREQIKKLEQLENLLPLSDGTVDAETLRARIVTYCF